MPIGAACSETVHHVSKLFDPTLRVSLTSRGFAGKKDEGTKDKGKVSSRSVDDPL